ncbi:MAG: calcium/sodium antiporter [Trueperaceae bacterium]
MTLIVGLLVLVVGAEALVRGASGLADRLGVPSLLVGLTVVAYGTSAPELTVSVTAGLEGNGALVLGNVIGSNVFNVAVIIGLAALATPIATASGLLRLDLPLGLAVTGLVVAMAWDGRLGPLEGAVLVAILPIVTTALVVRALRARGGGAPPGESAGDDPAPDDPARVDPAGDEHAAAGGTWRPVVLVVLGLGALIFGADLFVEAAVRLARAVGVSDLWIGLTVVAAGTSLPELGATVAAALRGKRDMALGNVIGSNLFNLTGVLGAGVLVSPLPTSVARDVLVWDLPSALVAAGVLWAFAASGRRIGRGEGAVLLLAYVAWVVFRA